MHVSGNRTIGNWDGSTVVVRVNEDGRALVHCAEGDMGQGAMTMLAQVVSHELDIPINDIHVAQPDTDVAPFCIGSLASRVTIVSGNAARRDRFLGLGQLSRPLRHEPFDARNEGGVSRPRGGNLRAMVSRLGAVTVLSPLSANDAPAAQSRAPGRYVPRGGMT